MGVWDRGGGGGWGGVGGRRREGRCKGGVEGSRESRGLRSGRASLHHLTEAAPFPCSPRCSWCPCCPWRRRASSGWSLSAPPAASSAFEPPLQPSPAARASSTAPSPGERARTRGAGCIPLGGGRLGVVRRGGGPLDPVRVEGAVPGFLTAGETHCGAPHRPHSRPRPQCKA